MNAIQVIEKLQQQIQIECTHLRNTLLIRETTITGATYINSSTGENLTPEQFEGRINMDLIQHCKLNLCYPLIDRFAYSLSKHLESTHLEPLLNALNSHHIGEYLTAEVFLDHLTKILKIDENFFERLLAYTLICEQIDKSKKWKFSADEFQDLAQNIKFNSFTLTKLTSAEDGYFFNSATSIFSVITLINNICDSNDCIQTNKLDTLNLERKLDILNLDRLDPYEAEHASKDIAGINVTAYKKGHIKITLDKEKAEILRKKVAPYLNDFHLYQQATRMLKFTLNAEHNCLSAKGNLSKMKQRCY